MGKYSLDAFERYPLVKLRPAMAKPHLDCCRVLELSADPVEAAELPELGMGTVLLRIWLNQRANPMEIREFLRKIGNHYSGAKGLAGVVLESGNCAGEELDQLIPFWRQSFDDAVLLVQPGTAMAEACRRQGMETGLWLTMEKGILPLRRAIGEGNLARQWETCPVYLYTEKDLSPVELDAARRWHASGANVQSPLGARMTLRRMMFPKELTSGGRMPLRMWWQNLGTAPLYQETKVLLELRTGEARFQIPISQSMHRMKIGDTTLNVTAELPAVPCGGYELWCGLESGGKMLPLSMEVEAQDGMYKIGTLTLDNVLRPYLKTMWEEQYADGYYPLEDPAQPE